MKGIRMNKEITKVIDLIPGKTKEITVLNANELQEDVFWEQFVLRHKPVLIKGAVKQWPAIEKWAKNGYLESKSFGEDAEYSETFNSSPCSPLKRGKLNNCIRDIFKLSNSRVYSIPSFLIPEKWTEDVHGYSFLNIKKLKKPLIYPSSRLFAYKNASTEWHYHPTDETITSQIVGSKKISLFRLNSKNWNLYYPFIKSNTHHLADGELYFPENSNLVKYEGILEPGDSLYIPPFWWHGVDPVDSTFGVTLAECFRTPLTRLGDKNEPVLTEALSQLPILPAVAFRLKILQSTIARKYKKEKWLI